MDVGGAVDSASQACGRNRCVNIREVLNAIFYVLARLPAEGTAEEPAAKEHRGSAWACVCGLPPPL